MAYLLGIDIGTSGTKTLLIDTRGRIVAEASAAYPCEAPRPAWSQQDPELWVRAVSKTVREVLAKVAGSAPPQILAIGLSGQMHGSVFVGRDNRPLRSAILWNDQRTVAECQEITERAGGRKKLIAMVANPALTGFTAPKILWVRRHEPKIFDRTVKVLLPKDYVRLRLTGDYATEVSDASGTLLLDVKRRQWSKLLMSKLDLDADLMPRCYESPEVTGVLHAEGARLLGLPVGVPVVGGGGDNAAGAVGNGIVRRGVLSASIGTSGVVFAHSDQVQIDPLGRVHTFCTAVPGQWHLMGVVLSAGGSLQWYRDQLCGAAVAEAARLATGRGRGPRPSAYDLITAEAARAPVGSHGLYFLPYLTGERTPHADPYARGCWLGLSNRHGRAELARSVMEGITYAMRDSLEIIKGLGVPVREIRLTGGGAKTKFWRQMQADVYGQRVHLINASEGPAYGAALLAGVGAKVWSTVPEACAAVVKATAAEATDRRSQAAYDRRYPEYRRLYTALRDEFAAMAEIEGQG